jgi:endonuclease YncB( thermonuclease family)
MSLFAILLVTFFGLPPADSPSLSGEVIEIIDGNTFVLKSGAESTTVVLEGIDCPENGQPFYVDAKKCLKRLILRKNIVVSVVGKDRAGNTIGKLILNDSDPRHDLLREGLAWPGDKNTDMEFLMLMQEAREKGIGLWSEEEPTPPWVYRRQQSMTQPKSS